MWTRLRAVWESPVIGATLLAAVEEENILSCGKAPSQALLGREEGGDGDVVVGGGEDMAAEVHAAMPTGQRQL